LKRQLAANQESKPRFGYVRSVIAEMKKVAWPSRDEAIRWTAIVLTVTLAAALIMGALDWGFSKFADAVLIK